MGKILFGVALVPMLFLVGFVVLFVAIVEAIGQSLIPTFGTNPMKGWMLDTPQATIVDYYGATSATPGGPVFSGGRVGWDGYSGDESFVCALPVEKGVLTDVYGAPRDPYPAHSGIDYGTCFQENLNVFSPIGGKVVFAGWSAVGYGNLIVIENAGWQVYLGHNNSFLAQVGEIVQAGQAVSLSGNTGNSSGPHVHFEVRQCVNGECTPRNPNLVALPGQSAPCDWYNLSVPCGR